MSLTTTTHNLPPLHSLILTIPFTQPTTSTPPFLLAVPEGFAQINGVELPSCPPPSQGTINNNNNGSGLPPSMSVPVVLPPGASVTITTLSGCTVCLTYPSSHLTSSSTFCEPWVEDDPSSHVSLINLHSQLHALRTTTLNNISMPLPPPPPRVLVVGCNTGGKTTVCETLIAYARRQGHCPYYVDLDPSRGSIYPYCIGVTRGTNGGIGGIRSFQSAKQSGGYEYCCWQGGGGRIVGTPSESPLAALWFMGTSTMPASFAPLHQSIVSIISSTINARLEKDKERGGREFGSGMIVNFLGGGQGAGVGGGGSGMKKYIEKMGKVVEEFGINQILVIGDKGLHALSKKEFSDQNVRLLHLPKASGVRERDGEVRREEMKVRMRECFYGVEVDGEKAVEGMVKALKDVSNSSTMMDTSDDGDGRSSSSNAEKVASAVSPNLHKLPFEKCTFYQITTIDLQDTMLPMGAQQVSECATLIPLSLENLSSKYAHSVVGICNQSSIDRYTETNNAKEIYLGCVGGIGVLKNVDEEKGLVEVLSPQGGKLCSTTFLVGASGDITWVE